MAKKQKYYVVWEGNTPGIYESWQKCQLEIKGYPGAKYKAFDTKEAAVQAFHGNYSDFTNSGTSRKSKPKIITPDHPSIIQDSVSVDAACSGNPGDLEYRGVYTGTGKEIFKMGVFKRGTNNIGEFLALVHALAMLKKEKKYATPIYSDSRTAIAWVRNKKVKTNLNRTVENESLFKLVERALYWLDTNSYRNPIIKWDTANWGEIPADFGRK